MRGLSVTFIVATLLLSGSITSGTTRDEPNDGAGVAEGDAIKLFWEAAPKKGISAADQAAVNQWVQDVNPWQQLCAEVVEEIWMFGAPILVPSSTFGGYYLHMPLAGWGAVYENNKGEPNADAPQDDQVFGRSDMADYLEAAGIYYNTHEGVGTTSYLKVTVDPNQAPLLCKGISEHPERA